MADARSTTFEFNNCVTLVIPTDRYGHPFHTKVSNDEKSCVLFPLKKRNAILLQDAKQY
jgi:hypothetical protein